jgi:signal transduction histidine kinase
MTDDLENATELHRFAAAVAHELRTPLVAVAGEVELALRRDRSAAEYREALRRIAAGISELVGLTGDLTLLSDRVGPIRCGADSASLATILAAIRGRYAAHAGVRIAIDGAADARVAGDERGLGRAITLVIEHAIRHRRNEGLVSLRASANDHGCADLAIDAEPTGFWPTAWSHLHASHSDAGGPLRLRTARRIVEDSGGRLRVAHAAGTEVVHIELRASG